MLFNRRTTKHNANFARRWWLCLSKLLYHRAFYSLDAGDGIENQIVFVSTSPQEIYERKVTQDEIYSAINQLPEKQAKRIYAHFFQDMSMARYIYRGSTVVLLPYADNQKFIVIGVMQ